MLWLRHPRPMTAWRTDLYIDASTIPGNFVSIHRFQWSNMIQQIFRTQVTMPRTDISDDSSSLCKTHPKAMTPDCFCISLLFFASFKSLYVCVLQLAGALARHCGFAKELSLGPSQHWCPSCRIEKPESQNFQLSRKRAFLRENIRRIVFLLLRLGSRWVKQQFWHDQIVGEPCCNHPEPVCAKLLNHYKRLSGYPRRLAGEEESRAWPSPQNAVLAVEKLLRKQI